MQIELFLEKKKELESKLKEIEQALNLEEKRAAISEMQKIEEEPSFWQDVERSKIHNQKKKSLERVVENHKKTKDAVMDFAALLELTGEGEIPESDILAELKNAEKQVEQLWLETLLSKKYDDSNCVLTIHAGAGGEEAQDWTEMLSRMYLRYFERQGFKAVIVDEIAGDGAGIKSQTIEVNGENAYGYLKCERGVHRLVRLSPFDSNNRRHTSFASVEVSPVLDDVTEVEIRPEDLRIDTYRSGGAGGQHVNKTDSAVRITHLPSGVVVQCQNERSQIQNKEQAMKQLRGKLAILEEEKREKERLSLQGDIGKIEWGNQIRSYVLHPYNMVKDHRTGTETSNTTAVLDGEIEDFITSMLKMAGRVDE